MHHLATATRAFVAMPTHLYPGYPAPLPVEQNDCPLVSKEPGSAGGDPALNRLFKPSDYYPSYFIMKDMQVERGRYIFLACPLSRRCPCCQLYEAQLECPVISVHGLYTADKKIGPRAVSAAIFGPRNKYNLTLPLDNCLRQTEQVAELTAAIYALNKVVENLERWKMEKKRDTSPMNLHTVVIKSDSAYVVHGITDWVHKWERNGWKNCKGQHVANYEGWQILDHLTRKLEEDICVKFWLVPREQNVEAEEAARSGLQLPKDYQRASNVLGHLEFA